MSEGDDKMCADQRECVCSYSFRGDILLTKGAIEKVKRLCCGTVNSSDQR